MGVGEERRKDLQLGWIYDTRTCSGYLVVLIAWRWIFICSYIAGRNCMFPMTLRSS